MSDWNTENGRKIRVCGEELAIFSGGYDNSIQDLQWQLENNYLSYARAHIAPNEVILDIGAGFGMYSLLFSRLYPNNQIIAFEPDPVLFNLLEKNIKINKINNILPLQTLPYPEQKNIDVFRSVDAIHKRGSTPTIFADGEEFVINNCKTTPIDNLRSKILGEIALAKITFPGEEIKILQSLKEINPVRYLIGEAASASMEDTITLISRHSAKHFCWRYIDNFEKISFGRGFGNLFLSVVVPVYNVEKYLGKCLDSILATKLSSVEFILVDDGSTDNSPQILEKYADKDNRVKIVRQKNSGCASARNTGLYLAKGEYVGFVDSDDWVDENFFDKLSELALTTGADVIQGGLVKHYELEKKVEEIDESWLKEAIDQDYRIINRSSFFVLQPTIWRRLYKRRFLKQNGISFHTQLKRFDDLPFQFEVFMLAETIALESSVKYHYRLQRKGQDVSATDERLFIHFEIFDILRKELEMRNKLEYAQQLLTISQNTHNWALSIIEDRLAEKYKKLAEECMKKTKSLST